MPAVQDAVFRGRFALSSPGDGGEAPGGGQDAERYFLEALAMDSTFVPALTGLAGTYFMRGLEVDDEDAAVELRRARSLAVEAVERDPASVEAREVLASVDEALMELDSAGMDVPPMSFGSVTEIGRLIQAAMARQGGESTSVAEELRAVRRLEASGRQGAARDRVAAALERFSAESVLWDEAERLAVSEGDWPDVVRLRREREDAGIVAPGPGADALEAALRRDGVMGYWRWKEEELGRAPGGRLARLAGGSCRGRRRLGRRGPGRGVARGGSPAPRPEAPVPAHRPGVGRLAAGSPFPAAVEVAGPGLTVAPDA